MEKSKLYTSTGDAGMTSLVGGTRVRKNSDRLEAYGTLDEFSSALGIVVAMPDCDEYSRDRLLDIQNTLFNLGGYLACEVKDGEQPQAWGLTNQQISDLEKEIDRLDAATPKVNAFVLPGGTLLSAHTHLARTICRRAERCVVTLMERVYVDPNLLKYINRLSDYLFILARYFNYRAGIDEIIWKK